MTEQHSPTDEQLGKEIEDLDREAREALDRLADRREELERRHRATELATQRQREREEERRREQEREAKEREERRRAEELERLGQERLQLEERAEREAETLRTTLEELLAFDRTHRRVIGPERFSIRADSPAPPDLPREIAAWFRGRFKKAIPAIGEDYRSSSYGKAGPSLPERDPLTPTASEAPGGEAHEAKLAEG